MFSIRNATFHDAALICRLGNISVEYAHRESCSAADMQEYLDKNYSLEAIETELADADNIYHIVDYNNIPAGYSKVVLNASHPNIDDTNVMKLDRLYLLPEYFDKKLGIELLKHNIDLAKQHHQKGIWLFTWVGNTRAVSFYNKAGFKIIGSHQFKVSENHSNENYHMYLRLDVG